jgi:hypothetical protein
MVGRLMLGGCTSIAGVLTECIGPTPRWQPGEGTSRMWVVFLYLHHQCLHVPHVSGCGCLCADCELQSLYPIVLDVSYRETG